MAILQSLLALISRSAGKILNAIFGWAVRALFGRASETERTLLSGLVAAAAVWPLLLAGLIAPKLAALLLAFVPLPHWVPAWTVRLVWAVLVLLVPCAIGVAVAMRGPPKLKQRPLWRRLLSGFPITAGLAIAFVIMFLTVPLLRIVAMLERQQSADVPLVTEAKAYHDTAALCVRVLNEHGFALRPAEPGWWAQVPLRVLRFFSHDAFASFVPERLEVFADEGLRVTFYPSGAMLRGKSGKLAWAHGLIAEATARIDGFQTTSSAAQHVEAQIHRLWSLLDEEPAAHVRSPRLLSLAREVTARLGTTELGFDDWQVLYRQLMQLERALRGQPQLLEEQAPPAGSSDAEPPAVTTTAPARRGNGHSSATLAAPLSPTVNARAPSVRAVREEVTVQNQSDPKPRVTLPPPVAGRPVPAPPLPSPQPLPSPVTPAGAAPKDVAATAGPPPTPGAVAATAGGGAVPIAAAANPVTSEQPIAVEQLSTVDLIKHITSEMGHLVTKQVELAKTELKADLKAEATMVGGLSIAAVAGLCTLNLLLVTAVLALAIVLPGWVAGLIVSGVTLLTSGLIGWLAWRRRVRSPLARTQRTLKDDVQWTRERLV